MRVNKFLMPAVAIVTLLGAILTARVVGAWQTSGRDMIDPTQPLTSGDLRGWMPLEYLMERLDLSQDELYALLGLPASIPPATPLKDLEETIEVSTVRSIVADYLDEAAVEHGEGEAPASTPAPTPTPEPDETPTPPSQGTSEEHAPGTGYGTGTGPTPLPPGQVLPAAEIKGRMTLREVSEQCAVSLEGMYEQLGLPEGLSPETVLRDVQNHVASFEVSRVREVVADLQQR